MAQNRFYRLADEIEEKIELDLSGITIHTLKEALQNILLDIEEEEEEVMIRHVQREEITVDQRINYITTKLSENERMTFYQLFSDASSKYEVIVTFMAILEMLKLNTN